ncbi:MAG: NAD(P)/FAD-dependent oxidoreductase [Oscillospiraceae bacterium]
MVDVAVIGGGPAGLSAAINARARGKGVLVVGNPIEENPLYKAPRVDNYPGLPGVSGAQLLRVLEQHARESGALLRTGRVLTVSPMGDRFFLSIGSDVEEARALVVAIGAQRGAKLPGEEHLLGRGVSWCATCDGMLYRNKAVVVVGLSHDAPAEANFLREIGCQVTYVARNVPTGLRPDIPVVLGKQLSIEGEQTVTAVRADEAVVPCQGAFVLREAVAPNDLLPGLTLEGGYVAVDRAMATNLPGVFACGDCTGLPLQAAKAAGEGLIAGQNAADYVDHLQI